MEPDPASAGPAPAIKVFTAGATREGIGACAGPFRRDTGIVLESATTHGHLIRDRVIAGDSDADVVVIPAHMVEDLQHRGLASRSDIAEVGTIRIGAAVRTGCPLPDVSSIEALRQALLGAASVVLTEAPSGVHMDSLIDRWGLRGALEDRITRYDTGTMVNEHLIDSTADGEIAFGVATEILFCRDRGVSYAGPIPDEVQLINRYVAARLTRSDRAAESRKLLAYLATPEARAAFARTGVEQEDADARQS